MSTIVTKRQSDVSLTVWYFTILLQMHWAYLSVWGWRVKIKREIWVRNRLLKADSVHHCGCGVVTGQCQPGHSGSSPTAYHHGKPPPPDGLLPHGSPPPAAVDWPPKNRSQMHETWPYFQCFGLLKWLTWVFLLHKSSLCAKQYNDLASVQQLYKILFWSDWQPFLSLKLMH